MINIGDKVVCVDDSPSKCPCCFGVKVNVVSGKVYTVNGIDYWSGGHWINLVGVAKTHNAYPGYGTYRFRKLDELKNIARQQQEQTNLV